MKMGHNLPSAREALKVAAVSLVAGLGGTATAHAAEGATVNGGQLKAVIATNQEYYGSPSDHAAGQTGVYSLEIVNGDVITTSSPNQVGAAGYDIPRP